MAAETDAGHTRETDHAILLRHRPNRLLAVLVRITPRIRMLGSHLAELRVQLGRFPVVVGDGLSSVGAEAILIERIDVNRRSNGMSTTDVLWQATGCWREDLLDGLGGRSPVRECLLFHAGAHLSSQYRPGHPGGHRAMGPTGLYSHVASASPPVTTATLASPLATRRAASSSNFAGWFPPW